MKPCWPVFAILGVKRVGCAGVTASHLAGLQELHLPFIPLQGFVVTKTRDDECTGIQTFNLEFVSRWQSYLQWQNCRQLTVTQREHLKQPPYKDDNLSRHHISIKAPPWHCGFDSIRCPMGFLPSFSSQGKEHHCFQVTVLVPPHPCNPDICLASTTPVVSLSVHAV